MKRILRAGYELVMEKEKGYTRDLYPCYAGFTKYFPEQGSEMRQVLQLALNPTENISTIKNILSTIGMYVAIQKISNA